MKPDRKPLIAWFWDYKSHLKCSRCPETHPACLQFHHRDPETKRFNISEAVRLCYSLDDILEEVKKCDVLCANCHIKFHHGSVA